MKKVLFLFLLIFFISGSTNAQTVTEKNARPKRVYNGPSGHAIGAVLSSSNGKGLSYRYWPQNLGFHVTFFPASNGESKFYNGGVTGYLNIREYEIGTLFLHVGMEYQYTSKNNTYTSGYPTYTSVTYTDKTQGWNLGFGPGLHVLQKYISMDIYLGYGAYIRDHSSSVDAYAPKDEVITTLTGGVAFFLEL